jgi:hypothetical protein
MTGDDRPPDLPPDHDWVTARHQCSALMMFGTLKALMRINVDTRNAQLGQERYRFDDSNTRCSVMHMGGGLNAMVHFEVERDTTISVYVGRKEQHEAEYTVALDDLGRCKLRRGGTQYDPWQVLKAHLDPLLFH